MLLLNLRPCLTDALAAVAMHLEDTNCSRVRRTPGEQRCSTYELVGVHTPVQDSATLSLLDTRGTQSPVQQGTWFFSVFTMKLLELAGGGQLVLSSNFTHLFRKMKYL